MCPNVSPILQRKATWLTRGHTAGECIDHTVNLHAPHLCVQPGHGTGRSVEIDDKDSKKMMDDRQGQAADERRRSKQSKSPPAKTGLHPQLRLRRGCILSSRRLADLVHIPSQDLEGGGLFQYTAWPLLPSRSRSIPKAILKHWKSPQRGKCS